MQAKIRQENDILFVNLFGALDYENLEIFERTCHDHLAHKKVIFNLSQLNFVGSSGITNFFQTLHELYKTNRKDIKLCGVKTEFRKMLEVSQIRTVEIYENEHWAKLAFTGYPVYPSNYNLIVKYLNQDMPGFI